VEPKIDAKQLGEIVAETTRMQERDAAELDPEQARQVLRELELPADRLEEARAAVMVRRVHEREQKQRVRLAFAAALLVLALGAVLGWRAHARSQASAAVTTTLAIVARDLEPVASAVPRSSEPELTFDAVLAHVPRGAPLDMSCDWLGPSGELRYQNHWQTKEIDKDVWPTHCRRRFGPADPAGAWSVQMKLGDRVLATGKFELE
jgi:hypothetical protein